MSHVVPTDINTGIVHNPAVAGSVAKLYGWSVREAAGSPAVATVIVHAGTDASGPAIGEIELAANGASTEWFGPQGVQMRDGIFVEVVAGTVEGVVFHS